MKPLVRLVLLGVGVFLASAPIVAHHAFSADFDINKPVKIQGIVTKVEWTNPHVWMYLNVKDETGNVTNWGFEMGAPHQLQGRGWTRDLVKLGDELSVEGHRTKDGTPRMNGRVVTMVKTGQRLGTAGSNPQAEAPATP
jgi:Family of unknown function (DUF6152)